MRCLVTILFIVLLATTISPAEGGIFGRRAKPKPAVRVPELVGMVKADADDRKRASAAEELREYDAKTFPEIIPTLIDVLQTDATWGVRLEAAQSLGRMRPVSQAAGQALERAAAHDESLRVRIQARYSLTMYQLSGYRNTGGSKETPAPTKAPTTDEPPLYDGPDTGEAPRPLPLNPSSAPSLKPAPKTSPAVPASRPANQGSKRSLLNPFGSRQPASPPPIVDEGPILTPPK
jgi:hypothetical protein